MTKPFLIAALLAHSLTGVTPASAASLDADRTAAERRDIGAFAGARLRIGFGGTDAGTPRAALAIAPTVQTSRNDGSFSTRFGSGLELGISDRRAPTLSLAGRPLNQLATGRAEVPAAGRRAGISTLGYVAVGVGVAVIVGGLLFVDALNDASE